eukprot:2878163-Rhodomonas_salina.1
MLETAGRWECDDRREAKSQLCQHRGRRGEEREGDAECQRAPATSILSLSPLSLPTLSLLSLFPLLISPILSGILAPLLTPSSSSSLSPGFLPSCACRQPFLPPRHGPVLCQQDHP